MGRARNLQINPHDIIGRAGGLARAKTLSAERRKEIAVKAAKTRWGSKNVDKKVFTKKSKKS